MKKIIDLIKNRTDNYIPMWLMRQAGRYLPEYREIRAKTSSFLEMCYSPELASRVTLQPIERFDFDAAIIFSDILVVPHAMGVNLTFEEGIGPLLTTESLKDLNNDKLEESLSSVYEAIAITRASLAKDKALIGFAGAPWTLASYILEGKSSKDFIKSRSFMVNYPKEFSLLIDKLTLAVTSHLNKQIEAGADIIQIFDSWAGALNANEIINWVIKPAAKIVSSIKEKYPHIPIIGFPRNAGVLYKEYANITKVDVVGIDQNTPIDWIQNNIDNKQLIQGNLDPVYLLSFDKELLKAEIERIKFTAKKPFIFNLGHGILPNTPLENVELLVKTIRTNG